MYYDIEKGLVTVVSDLGNQFKLVNDIITEFSSPVVPSTVQTTIVSSRRTGIVEGDESNNGGATAETIDLCD